MSIECMPVHFFHFWNSMTLFGNLKGPVEQGNLNTCSETKLCLILFYSNSSSSLLWAWSFCTVVLNQARIDLLKTLLHKQRETTVSNKNKCIAKFQLHNWRKSSSTLCWIANLINTNNSTSIEENSKTLVQNKFNTCQLIQNWTSPLPMLCTQTLLSFNLINFFFTTLLGLTLFCSLSLRMSKHIYTGCSIFSITVHFRLNFFLYFFNVT